MTPDGWRSARLGGLARVNPEQLGNRTNPDYVLEYLDIAAVERPGVIGARRTLTFAEAPSRARRRARTGDILVSTVRPYLRNFAHVREAPSNLVASTGYAVVRPTDEVDGPFLYQHVLSDAFVEFLKLRMSGSNYPAVKSHDVGAYTLFLPPLAEQRKIAAILSSVDDAIEKTQAAIDQVQVVKRGLMQELLTRGLPGRHTRFRQTEIGEIPEAWRLLPLECFIEDGPDNGLYRPQRNYGEGTPIVRIDAFDNGVQLRRPQLRRVFLEPRDVERFAVNPGDILINRVNSMSHLAKCALAVSFDEPTVYESNIMRLSLDDSRLTTEFGFRWLSSEQVKTHLRRKAKRAVAQASINQNDVLTIPTPCPPRAEQRRIAEVIGIIEQRLESETDALEGLTKFKLALMSVVLTGELRVTPDPETI